MTTEDKIKQLSVILIDLIDTLDGACTSDTDDSDHSHNLFDSVDNHAFCKLQGSLRELL